MGYQTEFRGKLYFTCEMIGADFGRLNEFCGEDFRDHPEWSRFTSEGLDYINLKITKDFAGLEWDGMEKTYKMVECVNLIIMAMREVKPEFGLDGVLHAQGEDVDDRWDLVIGKSSYACKRDVVIAGQKIQCPHCEMRFYLED